MISSLDRSTPTGLSDLDTNHQKAKAGFDFDGLGPKNPLDLSVTGYHIIFLFIETILYSTLVIIVEYDWFNRMISSRHMGSMWIENDNDLDEDVLREKKAVLQSDQPAGYVSVKGLQKTYPGALVPAVKGVHFSVKPRQVSVIAQPDFYFNFERMYRLETECLHSLCISFFPRYVFLHHGVSSSM